MFYSVNSFNRGPVKKLLTANGIPAETVRVMRTGELGKKLHELVEAGIIPQSEATSAVGDTSAQQTPVATYTAAYLNQPTSEPSKANGSSAPANNESEALRAMQALIAALTSKPALDASEVEAIVADKIVSAVDTAVKAATAAFETPAPRTIEIKVGEAITSVDGVQHAMFETLVRIVSTRVQGRRLHAWLVGPSGSGKSFLAHSTAKAISVPYYSTSAIQSKYDLIGFQSPTGDERTLRTPFREAFENGGLFAWDDIDASDPRAFVAFNEALSNGRFAFPDKVIEQHPDFVCVASANTWGNGATADYVGRNKIDSATLSRFVRIEVDYDEKLERDMVGNHDWAGFIQRIRKAVKAEGIKVLVTPRHTLQGVALLAAGVDRKDVERFTVFAGLDEATVARLKRAA